MGLDPGLSPQAPLGQKPSVILLNLDDIQPLSWSPRAAYSAFDSKATSNRTNCPPEAGTTEASYPWSLLRSKRDFLFKFDDVVSRHSEIVVSLERDRSTGQRRDPLYISHRRLIGIISCTNKAHIWRDNLRASSVKATDDRRSRHQRLCHHQAEGLVLPCRE
jgi:hypothetical protein